MKYRLSFDLGEYGFFGRYVSKEEVLASIENAMETDCTIIIRSPERSEHTGALRERTERRM